MSTYETAASTLMLATHCACCGRPLRDAHSVETGVGPDCRKKYGYAVPQGEPDFGRAVALVQDIPSAVTAIMAGDSHKAANVIVHHIAIRQSGLDVARWTTAVEALGFKNMAAIIADRIGRVVVTAEGTTLVVEAPYNERFNEARRAIRGSSFSRDRKAHIVPASARKELWAAIVASFEKGTVVQGTSMKVL